MSKRINIYIRDITYKLLADYCDKNEYDKSRAVDDLIYGRLSYLIEAEKKAKKQVEKESKNTNVKSKNQQFVDDYWNNFKENENEM